MVFEMWTLNSNFIKILHIHIFVIQAREVAFRFNCPPSVGLSASKALRLQSPLVPLLDGTELEVDFISFSCIFRCFKWLPRFQSGPLFTRIPTLQDIQLPWFTTISSRENGPSTLWSDLFQGWYYKVTLAYSSSFQIIEPDHESHRQCVSKPTILKLNNNYGMIPNVLNSKWYISGWQ